MKLSFSVVSVVSQPVPDPEDEVSREAPSVPTGVRIDQAKVMTWHNDLVRVTHNFPTEKLERVYTSMAKVSLIKCTAATMVRIFLLGPNSDFLLERGPKMVRILCKSQNFQLNTRVIL